MTWRSLTCFSLLLNLTALSARPALVSGRVVLQNSRLAAVTRHSDYAGVVISLVQMGLKQELVSTHAQMLQKDKTFKPHILPVTVGTTVDFPNEDPIFHNAFSSYNGQVFDVGLYPPGASKSIRFSRPGVVRVFCNIHPDMSAIILVLPTPYFVETGHDGSFQLNVPAGEYQLNVFHERATQETLQQLTQRISVGSEGLKLPDITVSESGYLALPHKNKYGHDYPPESGDELLYPGAKK